MAKTIIVFGYGPGISHGVAHKFGREGFNVALVGRTRSKVDEGVKELTAKGIKAAGFVADLNDPVATRAVVGEAREALGPISVIEWTPYTLEAGNLLTATHDEISAVLGIATSSLLAAVQASLADLKAEKGAVLITNGGFLFNDPAIDKLLIDYDSAGLGLANAVKHKLTGILHQQLKADGVYVGEIVITGQVKGTTWDRGQATLEPVALGQKYWDFYQARGDWFVKHPS